jgi:hypothetical protein
MNKSILIAMPVIAILLGATAAIHARASIIGEFGKGYDAGKAAGYAAFYQGIHDASYPYDFSTYVSWCTGYHLGYNDEQSALRPAEP